MEVGMSDKLASGDVSVPGVCRELIYAREVYFGT